MQSLSLFLSVSLSAPRESLENSVKVSSSRRVVSLWGFEGRVVSLSIPPPLLRSPSDSRVYSTSSIPPSRRDGVVGANAHRNQTRNARTDFKRTLPLFLARRGLFGSRAHPRRSFSVPGLSRFFLSFLADLSGDHPPAHFATLSFRGFTKG